MFRLRSIGWRMFRWRSSRWPSVTRRHIEFLFGVSNVKQVRAVERIIKRNREETVVSTTETGRGTMSELFATLAEGDWQLPPSDESKVGLD